MRRGISRSVIATYAIPFWFSTEKSYLLRSIYAHTKIPVIVEVVFGLRRELGEKTLCDLSKVSSGFLVGSTECLFTQNDISRT